MSKNGRISLGTKSIRRTQNEVIVAYVIVPEDQDRNTYVSNCLKTRTVMLRDEYGGFWNRAFIPKNNLEDIVFPENSGDRGSMVICNKVPKHDYPVVVAVFDLKNVASYISDEYQFRQQKISEKGNLVDVFGDSSNGRLDITVNSKESKKGKVSINVLNPDKTAEFELYVRGNINIIAEDTITTKVHKDFKLQILDKDNKLKAEVKYEQGDGFTILDEFKNTLKFGNKQLLIKEGGSDNSIEVTDKLINIGKQGSAGQSVVLGDNLKNIIDSILDALIVETHPTALGPSGPPINSSQYSAIKSRLETILSKKVKTE